MDAVGEWKHETKTFVGTRELGSNGEEEPVPHSLQGHHLDPRASWRSCSHASADDTSTPSGIESHYLTPPSIRSATIKSDYSHQFR